MKRLALLGCVLLCTLLGLVLLHWSDGPGAGGDVGPVRGPVSLEASAQSAELETAPAKRAHEAVAVAREARRVEAAPGSTTAQPTQAAGAAFLHGEVSVLDEHGQPRPVQSGTITFVLWSGERGRVIEEIHQGRYRTEVAAGQSISIYSFVIQGRKAIEVEKTRRFTVPVDGRKDFVLQYEKVPTLRVVSEVTGLDLDEVEVFQSDGYLEHPGETRSGRTLSSDARSPVPLLRQTRSEEFRIHVRGRDHAWGVIEIDRSQTIERIVVLEAGGSLQVTLVGEPPPAGSFVRLLHAGTRTAYAEIEVEGRREIRFESCRPGEYEVKLEIGRSYKNPMVLGSTRVEILAGSRGTATLVVEAAPKAEAATVSGVLTVPAAWREDRPTLAMELLDSVLPGFETRHRLRTGDLQSLANGSWSFHFSDVQPGWYELELSDPLYSISFEVPPAGLRDVRFEVPAPALVVVRVVDRQTGEPAEVESLAWHPRRPPRVSGGSLESARSVGPGEFQFRAPVGDLGLSAHGGGYGWRFASMTVQPGDNEFRMEVELECGVQIEFRDGGSVIPWDYSWGYVDLKEVDGDGRARSWGSSGKLRSVQVSHPGLYELSVPTPPGYRTIPPRQVRIPPGKLERVVVDLERAY